MVQARKHFAMTVVFNGILGLWMAPENTKPIFLKSPFSAPSVEEGFESYEERQLAHALMRNPRRPLDLDAFSQGMRIQSMHAEKMMDTLRERLMRDFATSSGSFVSGRGSMPLPWWMAKK